MQLSDLLGLDVYGEAAERLGTIVDVRLAVHGDLDEGPSIPSLFGLVVSPDTRSSYFGYERSDARRPKAFAAFLRWRHRRTFLVLWDDIARIDRDMVRLRHHFTRYSPTLRSDHREDGTENSKERGC